MNFKCISNGHNYEKIREDWVGDLQDEFYASNYGTSVKYFSYDVFRCNRCLKEKRVYNGKSKIE